jgi:DNA-directed RNA polymerase specialized sigma24 family protein
LIEHGWFARFEDMPESPLEQVRESIELLYRADSGRILATLIRLLGDFDLAEESMHEAFAEALRLWHKTGFPANPRPWLISTARFKAIDIMRRRAHFDALQQDRGCSCGTINWRERAGYPALSVRPMVRLLPARPSREIKPPRRSVAAQSRARGGNGRGVRRRHEAQPGQGGSERRPCRK